MKFSTHLKTSESFPKIYIFFEVKFVAIYAIATTAFSVSGLLR